jgi:antitoxin (DNA-binding transcriptional repressor) of toxin-antitoxin stability system
LDGRRVVQVAFQQAPTEAVDDLVIHAQRNDEASPSFTVAVGIRRHPLVTPSDRDTQKLLTDYIRSLIEAEKVGSDQEYFLVVAGPQAPAGQLATLAALARTSTEEAFYPLVAEPGRFERAIRTRLNHFLVLVTAALTSLGMPHTEVDSRLTAWRLLRRLTVLQPRYEAPDLTDWGQLVNALQGPARGGNLDGARALRDRLEVLAGTYAPQAATVDQMTLLRDVRPLVSTDLTRFHPGWAALVAQEQLARSLIRSTIGQTPDFGGVHLDRSEARDALRALLHTEETILVHGESGAGKSALVMNAIDAEKAESPDAFDAVYLSLRQLPDSGSLLDSSLGAPLADLLRVMNAPTRAMVIDAADYLAEAASTSFAWVVQAARAAEVKLVIVATSDSLGALKAELGHIAASVEFKVDPLDDGELETVVSSATSLRALLTSERSRDLLRRPVVADLLARAQVSSGASSETDAMAQVWEVLVRRDERNDHGAPDARDRALKLLAEHALGRLNDDQLLERLDLDVVDALRRDGLLGPASTSPWQRAPEFFHEQVRLYAVSQVLLSGADPVSELIAASAPRWALPAARLAAQYLLAAADSPMNPQAGRFERLQTQFDKLPEAGFGERWADLPAEAALPLEGSRELLSSAWPSLVATNGAGLARLFRVVQQRHLPGGLVDAAVAEPLVFALLEHGWPSELNKKVEELTRDWLRALIISKAPAGHPVRVTLRDRIVARVVDADAEAEAAAQATRDALAARTPEQIAEDEARTRRIPAMSSIGFERRRPRTPRPYLPRELTDDAIVEQLGLLGPDLGPTGEALLRRIAENAPADLELAVDGLLGGRSLASYSPALLVELAEAYYIDDVHPEDDDFGWSGREEGVRRHGHSRGVMPFSSAYHGPFLAMLQTDFRGGIAFIARLLNHASLCRVKGFRRWQEDGDSVADNSVTLSITGEPQSYIGDSNVWLWYRGGGVGPYPCMSALQALEVIVDQFIVADIPLSRLVEMLMANCNNLAMPGLVVGMLVRHLESAGTLLDPYLAEPQVWRLEFGRVVQETTGFTLGKSDDVDAPERRKWSFKEVSMMLALNADSARVAELDAIADILEERARVQLDLEPDAELEAWATRQLASVAGWASSLRRSSLRMTQTDGGVMIEGSVPDAVAKILEPTQVQGQRMSDAYGLANRYDYARHSLSGPPAVELTDLHNDVKTARALVGTEEFDGQVIAEACSALACSVVERRFIQDDPVDEADLLWAAELLLEVASAFAGQAEQEAYDFTYFSHTPDIPASRAVALLLLPEAGSLRKMLSHDQGEPIERIIAANRWAATHGSLDGRFVWSRSLDHLWHADPIDLPGGETSHALAYSLIEESLRGTILGDWDAESQTRTIGRIVGPVDEALADASPKDVIAERLIPGIRGLQQLAIRGDAAGEQGFQLLTALLTSYSTTRQQEEFGPQHSQTDMLAVARALLLQSAHGKPDTLFRQLEGFIDRNDLLDEFMGAIAAAAEENQDAAATAIDIWPQLMEHAMNLMDLGHIPVGDGWLAARGIASLIPNIAYDNGYLLRELDSTPIVWIDFDKIASQIDRWVPFAAGHRESIDQLIALLRLTSMDRQVSDGLPWIEDLVSADPIAIAGRSYLLPEWLAETRSAARATPQGPNWQRIVDLLVVAGEERIAALTD